MKSKHILALHTVTFISFVLGSMSTPFLAVRFPDFFSSWYYLAGVVLILVAVLGSWKLYGGCFFTVWENHFREREQPGSSYHGSCLPYYADKWFGWKIRPHFFTVLLLTLLFLPIISGVI